MRTRLGLLSVALLLLASGCGGGDDTTNPPAATGGTASVSCVTTIPAEALTSLGWTATADGTTAVVRGCRQQASQGYVEVRRRTASYDAVCNTLDRSGRPGPGKPATWLGKDVTACAVEPAAGAAGQTKVVVPDGKKQILQVFVAASDATPRDQVRAAVRLILTANPNSEG